VYLRTILLGIRYEIYCIINNIAMSFKDYILEAVRKMTYHSVFDRYKITVVFDDEDDTDEQGRKTQANIMVYDDYRSIKVRIKPDLKTRYPDEKKWILETLSHEMCHSLTNKLSTLALDRHATADQLRDADEELTERISWLFNDLYLKAILKDLEPTKNK